MKGKINRGNYEAYFLDYLEGRLPAEVQEELFLFLESHPGLKEELEEYEEVRLTPPGVAFEGKQRLKRADLSFEIIDELNAERAMVAYYEGELNPEQEEGLQGYLKENPGRRDDFKRYGKVYLKPPQVIYGRKRELIRRERKIVVWVPASAAAVALLLALSLFLKGPGRGDPVRQTAGGVPQTGVPVQRKTSGEKPLLSTEKAATEEPTLLAEKNGLPRNKAADHRPEQVQMSGNTRETTPEKRTTAAAGEKDYLAFTPVIRSISLPVNTGRLLLRNTDRSLQTEDPEDIDLLAEQTGLRIRKNILRKGGDPDRKVTAREFFYNSLAKINSATRLNFHYEKMEEPDKGKEYVAVTSRFFTYIRRKEENR